MDSLNRFLSWLSTQGVERKADQPFIHEKIADSWNQLPEAVRNFEPKGFGGLVDDLGNHSHNQRLPGGYHLSTEGNDSAVHVHYDAFDPLKGPSEVYFHWYYEVRPNYPSVFQDEKRNWR